MKHYKDPTNNQVYAFESDGSQDPWIPPNLVPITDAEAEALLAPPPPTTAELIAANVAAVQTEMDRQAKARGYDSILTAVSYAAQPAGTLFQAESAAFLAWRTDVWAKAYAVLADVQAGTVPMPTPAEAVAQMPALVLPS